MITKIWCGRTGQVAYEFSNGNSVSFVWGWGSYSDNKIQFEIKKNGDIGRMIPDPDEALTRQNWESHSVEVYSMCKDTNGFTKYLIRKYGQNPAAYVPVEDIPKILKRADREAK